MNAGGPMRRLSAIAVLLVGSMTAADAPKEPARRDLEGEPLPPGVLARMGSARLRHVVSTLFTSDGKALIGIGDRGSSIYVWDVGSGRLVKKIEYAPLPFRTMYILTEREGKVVLWGYDEPD